MREKWGICVENGMELQQVIYNVFRTQIQFGVYRYEERLPTIEDAARLFMVSVKTIRAAYQNLQRDGYITISKSVGVKVCVCLLYTSDRGMRSRRFIPGHRPAGAAPYRRYAAA